MSRYLTNFCARGNMSLERRAKIYETAAARSGVPVRVVRAPIPDDAHDDEDEWAPEHRPYSAARMVGHWSLITDAPPQDHGPFWRWVEILEAAE